MFFSNFVALLAFNVTHVVNCSSALIGPGRGNPEGDPAFEILDQYDDTY